jgi:hypothetical protein
MKFTDALFLFCILSIAFFFSALITSLPASQLAVRIVYAGLGIFSCWWHVNNLSRLLFVRLCRFFKAIPRCWADSKETSK